MHSAKVSMKPTRLSAKPPTQGIMPTASPNLLMTQMMGERQQYSPSHMTRGRLMRKTFSSTPASCSAFSSMFLAETRWLISARWPLPPWSPRPVVLRASVSTSSQSPPLTSWAPAMTERLRVSLCETQARRLPIPPALLLQMQPRGQPWPTTLLSPFQTAPLPLVLSSSCTCTTLGFLSICKYCFICVYSVTAVSSFSGNVVWLALSAKASGADEIGKRFPGAASFCNEKDARLSTELPRRVPSEPS
mmetsp:Transcript_107557/g.304149  ORF Transcript_107557/g.304149 Transcript_107557/m.304149 type:complete len:247 (+) Transcript_107557:500-1240(+)